MQAKILFIIIIILITALAIFSDDNNLVNQIVPVYPMDAFNRPDMNITDLKMKISGVSIKADALQALDDPFISIKNINSENIIIFLEIDSSGSVIENIEEIQKKMINISELSNLYGIILCFGSGNPKEIAFITKTLSSIVEDKDINRVSGLCLDNIDDSGIESLINYNILFHVDFFILNAAAVDIKRIDRLKGMIPSKAFYYRDSENLLDKMVLKHSELLSKGIAGGFIHLDIIRPLDIFSVCSQIFDNEMYPESNDYDLLQAKDTPLPFYSFFNSRELMQTLIFQADLRTGQGPGDEISMSSMDIDDPLMYIITGDSIEKNELSYRLFRSKNSAHFLNLEKGGNTVVLKYIPYSLKSSNTVSEEVNIKKEKIITAEDILAAFYPKKVISDTMLSNYIAYGTTFYYFSTPAFEDKIEVRTEDKYFYKKGEPIEWKEEAIFLNGSKWSRQGFPEIPFIGSGQLDIQPSDINFDDIYEYVLLGQDRINNRDCYKLLFTPKDSSLPNGNLYIDIVNYQLVRLEYFKNALQPPLVSSQQIEDYSYLRTAEISYIIPERIRTHEVINMAGRNIIIDKSREYKEILINCSDFEEQKKAAYNSGETMMQLTEDGPKLLKKDDTGNRILQDKIKKNFLFLAGGLVGDLESKYPLLPLAGINYFDYDFMEKGYHLNIFTAVAINVLTVSTGKPVFNNTFSSLSFDLVAPIVSFTDQVYYRGEHKEELDTDIYTVNANFGLTKRLSNHLNLYLSTQMRYEDFKAAEETDPEFEIPDSGFVISQSSEFQMSYYGLSGSAGIKYYLRTDGGNFGIPSMEMDNLYYGSMKRNWFSYSINIKKDFDIKGINSLISLSYKKLENTDRYNLLDIGGATGGIHGFSSGKIKTDEAFSLNIVTGFDIANALKWKLYVDSSYLFDIYSDEYRLYYGAGFSFSLILWKSYVCNIDYGYGFNQPNSDNSEGNHKFSFVFIKFLK